MSSIEEYNPINQFTYGLVIVVAGVRFAVLRLAGKLHESDLNLVNLPDGTARNDSRFLPDKI